MLKKALELRDEVSRRHLSVGVLKFNEAFKKFVENMNPDIVNSQILIGDIGVSSEHFMKSFLASINPCLIVKNPSSKFILVFSTEDEKILNASFDVVRDELLNGTVDFADFGTLVNTLNAIGGIIDRDIRLRLDALRKARNETIHGLLSISLSGQVNKFFYTVSKLIVSLGFKDKLFNDEFLSYKKHELSMMKLIEDFEMDKEKKFFSCLASAKEWALNKKSLHYSVVTFREDEIPFICPICNHEGYANGSFLVEETLINYGMVEDYLYFQPREFKCLSCQLQASGFDELYLSDIAEKIFVSTNTVPPKLPRHFQDKGVVGPS